jgi:hypothetical protein
MNSTIASIPPGYSASISGKLTMESGGVFVTAFGTPALNFPFSCCASKVEILIKKLKVSRDFIGLNFLKNTIKTLRVHVP